MVNIITFLIIIAFFILLFSIFTSDWKIVGISGILLIFFIISVGYYYFVPINADFINSNQMRARIELENIPSWQTNYRLTTEENESILKTLGGLEVKRLSGDNHSYYSNDSFVILIEDLNNFANLYTVIINPEFKTGKIVMSGSKRSYTFEIQQKELDIISEIFNEYKTIAFENDLNQSVEYTVSEIEKSYEHIIYQLNLTGIKSFSLNNAYVVYKSDGSVYSRYISEDAIEKENDDVIARFKTVNPKRKDYDYIKLVLRGQVLEATKIEKFQKVIDLYIVDDHEN